MYYLLLYSFLFFLPGLVYSHHPLNGGIMESFNDGFLSGIGHPILGLDHLAFIVGIGLFSYISRKFYKFSFSFILGTLVGLISIRFGLYLPFYEIIVSFTLILLSYVILSNRGIHSKVVLFSIFGIFHGWAYGAILLDKPLLNINILLGYSLGLFLTQLFIAFLGYQLFKFVKRFKSGNALITPIFSGIMIGIASVNLFEIFESNIFNL